jgi:cell division protein FtsA
MSENYNDTKIISAIDIGSSKTVCFIGISDNNDNLEIIGIGKATNKGLKKGSIVDREEVIHSIKKALEIAEKMAGFRVRDVLVSISGLHVNSQHVYSEVNIDYGKPIKLNHLQEALSQISPNSEDEEVIFCMPINCIVDGEENIKNPVGMYGINLGIVFNVVTVKKFFFENLKSMLEEASLNMLTLVSAGHAAALACLTNDDMTLGSIILDLGAENISIGKYENEVLTNVLSIPLGANTITIDIAKSLNLSIDEAEKLKVSKGAAISMPADELEQIYMGEKKESEFENINPYENENYIEKALLNKIIQSRIYEIFEFIKTYLTNTGILNSGTRIILTGGGAMLSGIREAAEDVFEKNVKIAGPKIIKGVAENFKMPQYSCVTGCILYGLRKNFYDKFSRENVKHKGGYLDKIRNWIKEKL